MTDHSKTSQDLRTLIASKIAHARDYAEREGFMVSTVCLPPEQADIVIAALAPSTNGTEASRGVETWGVEDTGDNIWVGPMRRNGAKVARIVYGQEDLHLYNEDYQARVRADARLICDSVNRSLSATPTPPVSPPDSTGQGERKRMAEGCCSAVSPCSHQQRDPYTLCETCMKAAGLTDKTLSQADAQTQEGGE